MSPQEKLLRVLGYRGGGGRGDYLQEKLLRVLGALVYTYKKDRGVPYIYSGIAYDSRRGCGNTRVQWGAGLPAHERTAHTKEQNKRANPLARFQNGKANDKTFPSSFCSGDSR